MIAHRVDDDEQSVVRPGAQFHAAVLQVKGEMQDDDLAVALEDGRRVPRYHPGVLQQDFGLVDDGKVAIGTAEEEEEEGGQHEKNVKERS